MDVVANDLDLPQQRSLFHEGGILEHLLLLIQFAFLQ